MALSPILTSSLFQKGLYESENFFTKCNRSFDGLVSGALANSVDIPVLSQITVYNTAAKAVDHADREDTKDDVGTANVPFEIAVGSVTEQYESYAETNGAALRAYMGEINSAIFEYYDKRVMQECQERAVAAAGANLMTTLATVLQDSDLVKIDKFFALKKINKKRGGLYCFVDANITEQFLALDSIKQARSFIKEFFEHGIATINDITYVITANLAQVSSKYTLTAAWLPGVAFIVKKGLERKEDYQTETKKTYIDYMSYFGVYVPKTEFSCVLKMK